MGTTIGLTGASEPVALQSDLAALAARVTKLESEIGPTPPLTPSPTNTFITTAAGAPIVDDKLNQWRLVQAITPGHTGLQIELMAHGSTTWVVDPPTQNVTELGIQLVSNVRTMVQKNTAGGCYANASGALGAWVQFPGPVPP
jgi:hypothetical protein